MPKLLKGRTILYVVLSIVTIISLAGAIYFYLQYQQTQLALKNPTLAAQQEASALILRVGKLIDLPKNEQPTIATVSDISKLKDQAFFRNGKNGDKVLIYSKAKKAILYDPIADKIVEVAPVNIGSTQPTGPIKVALYNGTLTTGLTSTAETFLKAKFNNLEIDQKANASRADYTKTQVIDLSGTHADAAKQIAAAENGEVVSQVPSGEKKPSDVDIMVILAK